MFTKLLIFVLLGSTLVLAAPSSETVELQEEGRQQVGDWRNQIGKWWENAKVRAKAFMDKIKKTFNQIINEQGPRVMELGKEKLAELEKKYAELQSQASEAIEKERQVWAARIEEWKKEGGEALEDGKEKLAELKEQAEAAIHQQTKIWSAKLHEWEQSIKDSVAELQEESS